MLRRNKKSSKGATFIEAAMVLWLFFLIVGMFMYFALRFYRYNVLKDVMSMAMREAIVDANMSVTGLSERFPVRAKQILQQNYGISNEDIGFAPATICYSGAANACVIQTLGEWMLMCPFCEYFGMASAIPATSQLVIEDPCFEDRVLDDGCEFIRLNGPECE